MDVINLKFTSLSFSPVCHFPHDLLQNVLVDVARPSQTEQNEVESLLMPKVLISIPGHKSTKIDGIEFSTHDSCSAINSGQAKDRSDTHPHIKEYLHIPVIWNGSRPSIIKGPGPLIKHQVSHSAITNAPLFFILVLLAQCFNGGDKLNL